MKRSASFRPSHLVVGVILLSLIPTAIAAFFLLSPEKGGEAIIRISLDDVPTTIVAPAQDGDIEEEQPEGSLGEAEERKADASTSSRELVGPTQRSTRQSSTSPVQNNENRGVSAPPSLADSVPSQTASIAVPQPLPTNRPPRRTGELETDRSGVRRTSEPATGGRSVQNVVPVQRTENVLPGPQNRGEQPDANESSDTDNVREALRDIRPR